MVVMSGLTLVKQMELMKESDSVETMAEMMVSPLAGEKEYSKAVLMADYWASLMAVSSVDYLVDAMAF